MHRLTLLAAGLLLATSAFAGQPVTETQPAALASVAAPAAADKVYPPLPSLTMLPPMTADDEDPPARPARRKKASQAQVRRSTGPVALLVVSDASHAYLETVGRQLDQALSR